MLRNFHRIMQPSRCFLTGSSSRITDDKEIFTHVNANISDAMDHLNEIFPGKIPLDWLESWRRCYASIKFNMPIRRTDGSLMVVEAYRAHHHYYKSPSFGGIRIAPEVYSGQMEALAIFGTIKAACHDIPFAGSKGGIRIDPGVLNEEELKTVCKRYVIELTKKRLVGSALDVLGPGMGCREREMDWMMEAYTELNRFKDTNYMSSITGKSIESGGVDGYNETTGFGISTAIKYFLNSNEFCNHFEIPIGLNGKKVILHGYGRVGSWTFKHLVKIGCKIVGIIIRNSAVYCEDGLDYDKLNNHLKNHEDFNGISGYTVFTKEESQNLLTKQCDILILAAIENTINMSNMEKIKAKMIVEGADAPVSYIAQKYLESKNIPILPAVIINAGSLMISYIEWLKGQYRKCEPLDRSIRTHSLIELLREAGRDTNICAIDVSPRERVGVQIATEEKMLEGCRTAFKYSIRYKVSIRTAAYAIAMQKIYETFDAAGMIYA